MIMLNCTIQHRTVLIIFALIHQTIIIAQMLSNGGEGSILHDHTTCINDSSWNIRSPSSAIDGLNSSRRLYAYMIFTRTANASSSGICNDMRPKYMMSDVKWWLARSQINKSRILVKSPRSTAINLISTLIGALTVEIWRFQICTRIRRNRALFRKSEIRRILKIRL